jgi:hypothetical protein
MSDPGPIISVVSLFFQYAADELVLLLAELQIPFKIIIRISFRKLTADDGFLDLPFLKKIAGYGHEVQANENDRQRG